MIVGGGGGGGINEGRGLWEKGCGEGTVNGGGGGGTWGNESEEGTEERDVGRGLGKWMCWGGGAGEMNESRGL